MLFSKSTVGLLAAACGAVAAPGKTVFKDVIVVGGGASGAHAAVRLRDDYGLSVALVEKEAILGGHVSTFDDPTTGNTYNYGVQSFVEVGNASAFAGRFGVETGPIPRVATTPQYINFDTASRLNYTAPSSAEQSAALKKYLEQCELYEHMLNPGFWNFPEPDQIPADLLLPFGEFATKHGIEAAVPLLWRVTAMGLGDCTKHLTMYVMQAFGANMARSFMGSVSSWIPASGRNQDLYDAIDAHLGEDVYRSTTVIDAKRTHCGVKATIKSSATGETSQIRARAIVLAIAPSLSNLAPFHLDDEETSVLDKFDYTRIWAGIVSNEALPVGGSLTNQASGTSRAKPQGWLSFPDLDFSARFDYLGAEKYFRILFQGNNQVTEEIAKAHIQADFERMIDAGIMEEPANRELEYVAWEAHGPMHARVSADELKDGFVQKQYGLLGKSSTWWTGGAFSMNFQTSLWQYNDIMLPKLVASLERNQEQK